jgi:hypothetical protein
MQAVEHPTHVFRTNNVRGRYRVSEQLLLFLLKRPHRLRTSESCSSCICKYFLYRANQSYCATEFIIECSGTHAIHQQS